jgi:peroxiredoxin
LSSRLSYLLLGLSAAALLSAHIAIKPGLREQRAQAAARTRLGEASEWPGRQAPDFQLTLEDGSTFRLSDHIGREIVVLNFFATWCVPCRDEMPELQRYADRAVAGSRPFLLVGIDAREPADQVARFVGDLSVRFPIGIDSSGALLREYGITAYPTTVVIGADGRVKLYQTGAIRNADVAFSSVVPAELNALAGDDRGRETAAPPVKSPGATRSGFTPPDAVSADGLSGRARAIAEAMPCPCGCDHLRVAACSCQTAKAINAKLRGGVDASLSDGQIMEQLNKEFCMKGM